MMQFFVAITPALALVAINNPILTLTLFVVFGQGHFVITYLYQWRSGLVTKHYLLLYFLIGCAMIWFINQASPVIVLLVTAFIFSIHYYFDEARILIGNNTDVSLLLLAPAIAVFNSYLLYEKFSVDIFLITFLGSLALLGVAWYRFGPAILFRKDVLCTHLSTVVLAYFYLQGVLVPSELILGAIIIHHYCTWYIYQYLRLRHDPVRVSTYITDVFVINIVIIAGFILFSARVGQEYFYYFYDPTYFYGWTMLHIIFTAPTLLTVLKTKMGNLKKHSFWLRHGS